ncbi:hypothetical protein CBM2609_B110025 [Cupriavidus taiwanensis]|nr:hypothetical protein CBM2604_B120024 [Cupriavidus taiwanensis]SOZ30307.1 hypothetical protein CBM2609_B110025 [Cupriavidus taiwanensis]SOZ49576.1 hypothetical protein CBM2610_B90025 [Cupriavidus taiwanensis]SPA01625.1 hypothetical protein CBM2626_B120240 [Cupriavidus taiwanensis]
MLPMWVFRTKVDLFVVLGGRGYFAGVAGDLLFCSSDKRVSEGRRIHEVNRINPCASTSSPGIWR